MEFKWAIGGALASRASRITVNLNPLHLGKQSESADTDIWSRGIAILPCQGASQN